MTAGPGVVEPVQVRVPTPIYPYRARSRHTRNIRVVVAVLVGASGQVLRASVIEPDPLRLGFDEAALNAAKKATFKPATRGGVPGKMWTKLTFDFFRPR